MPTTISQHSQLLSSETGLVQSLASEDELARYTLEGPDAVVWHFAHRLDKMKVSGRFIAGNARPSNAQILKTQEGIARQIHNIGYGFSEDRERAPGRWYHPADTAPFSIPQGGRDGAYLDQIATVQGDPGRSTFPKIDMALIAHCFQTPLWLWEVWEEAIFDHLLACSNDHPELLFPVNTEAGVACYRDVYWLTQLANESTLLTITQENKRTSHVNRGIGGGPIGDVDLPPGSMLLAGENHPCQFRLELPEDFREGQVLLFYTDRIETTPPSYDDDDLYLLSTSRYTKNDLSASNEYTLPVRGAINDIHFTGGKSSFLVLLVRPESEINDGYKLHKLQSISWIRQTNATTRYYLLQSEELSWLRENMLRLPQDKWRLFKREVTFVAG